MPIPATPIRTPIRLDCLRLSELKDIATASGYGSDNWTGCRFVRQDQWTAIYQIWWDDSEVSSSGPVYIQIRDCKLVLEF